jgi:hypothetical protein
MSNDGGYSVFYPGLAAVRQALQDCSENLGETVTRTGPGCTAAADLFPGKTSAVVRTLHAAHSARLSSYVDDIARHAASVQASMDNYRQAEQVVAEHATRTLASMDNYR